MRKIKTGASSIEKIDFQKIHNNHPKYESRWVTENRDTSFQEFQNK